MKTLFLAIDLQQDFMDDGALGVPGAGKDVERIIKFIRNNSEKISDIAVSIDTHMPRQIFHPCWWTDGAGEHPDPYTAITLEDLDNGKYKALYHEEESYDYVKNLETLGKKTLVIWPYHCLRSTQGAALQDDFAKLIIELSVTKGIEITHIIKGLDPLSEMYGIIKPEYSRSENINLEFLNKLTDYDKIIVAGEAKSHCVLESLRQILEYYKDRPEITGKIHVLEDGMSSIPGYEETTEETFATFVSDYGVKIVDSDFVI